MLYSYFVQYHLALLLLLGGMGTDGGIRLDHIGNTDPYFGNYTVATLKKHYFVIIKIEIKSYKYFTVLDTKKIQ